MSTAMSGASSGTRISSRNTFFVKRLFPVLWFGLIALGLTAALLALRSGRTVPPPVFIVPLLLLVIGYALMRTLLFDLADEVIDEGDALRVRFGSEEERIALADIINVSYAGLTNPPRATLTLRHAGRFGKEIAFSPKKRFFSVISNRSPLVSELIERVDAARRR
jgi:hypothetical protein